MGQQWIRWHELKPKDDRDELVDQGTWHEQWYRTTSREYCERVNGGAPGYYAGVDGWSASRCRWPFKDSKYRGKASTTPPLTRACGSAARCRSRCPCAGHVSD